MMKVIVKEVGKLPRIEDIENTLQSLQTLVGGYIETVTLHDNVVLICNEEGKIAGLPPNFGIGGDTIVGTAVFVAHDGKGEFTDLDDWQVEDIMSRFYV